MFSLTTYKRKNDIPNEFFTSQSPIDDRNGNLLTYGMIYNEHQIKLDKIAITENDLSSMS